MPIPTPAAPAVAIPDPISAGIPILPIIIAQLIGFVFSKILTLIFGAANSNQLNHQTLEQLLNTMSRDFANKVEEIVKNAFFENSIDTIKTDILTAHLSIERFRTTKTSRNPRGDQAVLNIAKHDIDRACAALFVQITKILLKADNPPKDTKTSIRSYLYMIEYAITTLQALAAVDLDISVEYIDFHQNYYEQTISRIEAYTTHITQLCGLFARHHPLRIVKQDYRTYMPDSFTAQYEQFKSTYPDLNWIKQNLTVWSFLVDGEVEMIGTTSSLPTNYHEFFVQYLYRKDNLQIPLSFKSSIARHDSDQICRKFAEHLAPYRVKPLIEKVTQTKTVWEEAKNSIAYAGAFNMLVEVLEHDRGPFSTTMIQKITAAYTILKIADRDKIVCRVLQLGRLELYDICAGVGVNNAAQDGDMIAANESLLHVAARFGYQAVVTTLVNAYSLEQIFAKNSTSQDATTLALNAGFRNIAIMIEQRKFDLTIAVYPVNAPIREEVQYIFRRNMNNIQLTLLTLTEEHPFVTLAQHNKWLQTTYSYLLKPFLQLFLNKFIVVLTPQTLTSQIIADAAPSIVKNWDYVDAATGNSLLHLAIIAGINADFIKEITELLMMGAKNDGLMGRKSRHNYGNPIFVQNLQGHTPKSLARVHNHLLTITYLETLERPRDLQHEFERFVTHTAKQLHQGMYVNSLNDSNQSLLFNVVLQMNNLRSQTVADREIYLRMFAALILDGIDVNIRDIHQQTVFDVVDPAYRSELQAVITALQSGQHTYKRLTFLYPQWLFSNSLHEKLYHFTRQGDVNNIGRLVQQGAAVSYQDPASGESALHVAVRLYDMQHYKPSFGYSPKNPSYHHEIIPALLASTPMVDMLQIKDRQGRNPIDLAVVLKKYATRDMLIRALNLRFDDHTQAAAIIHEIATGKKWLNQQQRDTWIFRAVELNCAPDLALLLRQYGCNICSKEYKASKAIAKTANYLEVIKVLDAYEQSYLFKNSLDYMGLTLQRTNERAITLGQSLKTVCQFIYFSPVFLFFALYAARENYRQRKTQSTPQPTRQSTNSATPPPIPPPPPTFTYRPQSFLRQYTPAFFADAFDTGASFFTQRQQPKR